MKNDEQLMEAYKSGDVHAFEVLYEKYSHLVYGYLKKRIRESEVEDLYQKVWRHLHEKRILYKGPTFLPWFFVMIRHLLIDEYRLLGKKSSTMSNQDWIEKMESPHTSSEEIAELLEKLPKETEILVRKYYLEGFSYEELEAQMGLSQTALRARLSRALKLLRKI